MIYIYVGSVDDQFLNSYKCYILRVDEINFYLTECTIRLNMAKIVIKEDYDFDTILYMGYLTDVGFESAYGVYKSIKNSFDKKGKFVLDWVL